MTVTLYHFPPGGPSRGALLAARAVGVDTDIKIVNLLKKEQLKDDFVKINPQHTIPTLVDGNICISDSHAIGIYLATVYGKDDSLYPKDPKQRAIVDQRLYFDCGILHHRTRSIFNPVLYLGEKRINDEHRERLEEALGFLNVFLEGNDFVAGKLLTIADCSLVASVSTIAAVGWNLSPYANVTAWITRCSLAIPGYAEANESGADEFGKLIRSKLAPGQL